MTTIVTGGRWLVLGWVLCGCGAEAPKGDTIDGDTATGEGSTGAGSTTEGPAATVRYSGCVTEDNVFGSGSGVQGVEFAVVDRPEIPPALTGADGCFELEGLPVDEDLVLSFTKDGYLPRLRPIHTGSTDFHNPVDEFILITEGFLDFAEWGGLGEPDLALGHMSFFVYDATAADNPGYLEHITVTSDVALPVTCYLPTNWLAVYTASDGCSTAGDNLGFFTSWGYEPGTLDATIERDGATCTAEVTDDGWALAWAVPGVPNTYRVPSRVGYETYNSVTCTP